MTDQAQPCVSGRAACPHARTHKRNSTRAHHPICAVQRTTVLGQDLYVLEEGEAGGMFGVRTEADSGEKSWGWGLSVWALWRSDQPR